MDQDRHGLQLEELEERIAPSLLDGNPGGVEFGDSGDGSVDVTSPTGEGADQDL